MEFPTRQHGFTEQQWFDWRTALKAAVAVGKSFSYGGDSVDWLGADEIDEFTLVVTVPSIAEHAWDTGIPTFSEFLEEKEDGEVVDIVSDLAYACSSSGVTDDYCGGGPRHNRKFTEKCDAEFRRVLEEKLGPERTAALGLFA